jgi:hypothetical protein
MDYLVAAVFGLGVGTLFSYGTFPNPRWLPRIATAAVLIIGAGQLSGPNGSPLCGIIIMVCSVIASILASAGLWAVHPLLATSGYWSRVWMVVLHERTLQRTWAEYARGESEAQGSSSPI